MVFLESTNFFVRTVMFDFINRNKDVKLKFRLVPMIHIGTEEFYENVYKNVENCDEIFYEGMNLKKLNLTFKQYKIIANKLGLVTQTAFFKLKQLKSKLTHTDFNFKEGREAWNELYFKEKIKLALINPLKLFISHQGISREILAKNYMTSSEEAYLAFGPIEDKKGTLTNLKMNKREQLIFKNIKHRMESESNLDKTIGIIYGAGHMKSIARYLIDKHNYLPKNGKFMKVFDVY